MACGCFPIAGDIESIREWITPWVNGLLVPPDNHEALARAIIKTVENTELLNNARVINRKLLLQKADANLILQKLKLFYDDLMNPDS
jgi:glycosyltransferase involved in cell wall biosynthesis